METQGKTVIILIFSVAIAATVFAWGFRKHQSQRLLELWGGEVASRIRVAKTVCFLELGKDDSLDETVSIGELNFGVKSRIETTNQPGMINAQAAIISDASYDWQRELGQPEWSTAFEFRDSNEKRTIIAFDLLGKAAICVEKNHPIGIGPKLADGLEKFISEIRSETDQENTDESDD